MTKLPVIAGRDLVRALRQFGFELDRQKGSHMILFRWCENPFSHPLCWESLPTTPQDWNPANSACEIGISHEPILRTVRAR